MSKILSLDLSTVSTGWAYFEYDSLVKSGTIQAKGKDLNKRLKSIYNDLSKLFLNYNPDKVVIEKPIFVQNHKTAITTGKLHGLLLSLNFDGDIVPEYLDNMQWKSHFFTGKLNKVTKEQIFLYVQNIIYTGVETEDEADAILLGKAFLSEQNIPTILKTSSKKPPGTHKNKKIKKDTIDKNSFAYLHAQVVNRCSANGDPIENLKKRKIK
jgi:Holliday junction resolvasome RuvABC endonuclease subunit